MTGLSLSISPLLLDYRRNNSVLSTLQKMIHASNNARRFSGRRPRRRTLKERKSRRCAARRFSENEWKEIRKGAMSC